MTTRTVFGLAAILALLALAACGPHYLRKPDDRPTDPWPLPFHDSAG